MTVIELDARARKMRQETQAAFDRMFDAMRQANLLMEFPPEDWAAYNAKHFGPKCKITTSRAPEPGELGWKDPHRTDELSEDTDL